MYIIACFGFDMRKIVRSFSSDTGLNDVLVNIHTFFFKFFTHVQTIKAQNLRKLNEV